MDCVVCNKETEGFYGNQHELPCCFNCYESGALLTWLNENDCVMCRHFANGFLVHLPECKMSSVKIKKEETNGHIA